MGGMLAAIETGYVQKQIQESAYAFQREMDSGERVIVGVNRFQDESPAAPLRTLKVSRESEGRQIARLARVKRERDSRKVLETLAAVKTAAADGKNLMPPILEAVKALATVAGDFRPAARRVRRIQGNGRHLSVASAQPNNRSWSQ